MKTANTLIVVASAVSVLTMAVPFAESSTITLSTRVTEGTGSGDTGDPYVSAQNCANSTSTSSTLTTSCSGSLPVDGSSGHYSGSATANGAFTNTLTLGAVASIDADLQPYGSFVSSPYDAAAQAIAQFEDLITLTGGVAGQPGFLELTFGVDGSLNCASLTGPGSCYVLPEADANAHAESGTGFEQIGLASGSNTVIVDLPYIFGQQNQLLVSLNAEVFAPLAMGNHVTGVADFSQTLSLTDTRVLSAYKEVLPGGGVVSASGLVYPGAAPAPVPEPASIVLLGTGLVALGARVRLGRSCRSRPRM